MDYVISGEILSQDYCNKIRKYLDNLDDTLWIIGDLCDKKSARILSDYCCNIVDAVDNVGITISKLEGIFHTDYIFYLGDVDSFVRYFVRDYKCKLNCKLVNISTGVSTPLVDALLYKKLPTDYCYKFIGNSLEDVLDVSGYNLKNLLNNVSYDIDFIQSDRDILYFDFILSELVPSNRGIYSSSNPEYNFMCEPSSEGFTCIDRRFLRGGLTNIRKVALCLDTVRNIKFSYSNFNSIMVSNVDQSLDMFEIEAIETIYLLVASGNLGCINIVGDEIYWRKVLKRIELPESYIRRGLNV